jgi:hypothetical protein
MRNGPPGPDLARLADHPDLFEAFCRPQVSAITRFVARRIDDPYLVADLTAEVFVVVIDSAHLLPEPRNRDGLAVRDRAERRLVSPPPSLPRAGCGRPLRRTAAA